MTGTDTATATAVAAAATTASRRRDVIERSSKGSSVNAGVDIRQRHCLRDTVPPADRYGYPGNPYRVPIRETRTGDSAGPGPCPPLWGAAALAICGFGRANAEDHGRRGPEITVGTAI